MPEPPFLGTVTPDEFRRIRAIFEAALDLPPAERRAFVEQACGGERALLAEVERMLATEGDRHQLLDRGSTDDATGGTTGRRSAVPRACPSCHAPLTPAHRFCQSCGTPTAAGSVVEEGRFRAGALFADRFRIVSALGRGGMGEVYRAHDLELGQPVALKFLTAVRSDSAARTRLRTGVRLARQISHPNVCRVYDIGEAHGELFLSMEYVDGEDHGRTQPRDPRRSGSVRPWCARRVHVPRRPGLARLHPRHRRISHTMGGAAERSTLAILLARFGLLAWVTCRMTDSLLLGTAFRFDTPPYATASYVILGVLAALTMYGLHIALAGRSLFGDDEIGGRSAQKA